MSQWSTTPGTARRPAARTARPAGCHAAAARPRSRDPSCCARPAESARRCAGPLAGPGRRRLLRRGGKTRGDGLQRGHRPDHRPVRRGRGRDPLGGRGAGLPAARGLAVGRRAIRAAAGRADHRGDRDRLRHPGRPLRRRLGSRTRPSAPPGPITAAISPMPTSMPAAGSCCAARRTRSTRSTSAAIVRADLLDEPATSALLAEQEWQIALALRDQARLRALRSGLAEPRPGSPGAGAARRPPAGRAGGRAEHRRPGRGARALRGRGRRGRRRLPRLARARGHRRAQRPAPRPARPHRRRRPRHHRARRPHRARPRPPPVLHGNPE